MVLRNADWRVLWYAQQVASMRKLVIPGRIRSCLAWNQPLCIVVVVQRPLRELYNVYYQVQTSSGQAVREQLPSVCSLIGHGCTLAHQMFESWLEYVCWLCKGCIHVCNAAIYRAVCLWLSSEESCGIWRTYLMWTEFNTCQTADGQLSA